MCPGKHDKDNQCAQVSMTRTTSVPGHVTVCALNRRARGPGHGRALRVCGLWIFCWPGDSARGAFHIQECGESCFRAPSVTCRVCAALDFIFLPYFMFHLSPVPEEAAEIHHVPCPKKQAYIYKLLHKSIYFFEQLA